MILKSVVFKKNIKPEVKGNSAKVYLNKPATVKESLKVRGYKDK